MSIHSLFSVNHWQLLMSSPTGGAQPEVNPIAQFGPLILIFAIIYFMFMRPQKKRQKAREELIKQAEKGDKVITASGIHGTVAQVEDTTVLLQVSDNTKIRIEKTSLGTVIPKNADKSE